MTAIESQLATVAPLVSPIEEDFKIQFSSGKFRVHAGEMPNGMIDEEAYLAQLQSRYGYVIPTENLASMQQITAVCIGLGVMGRTMEELARYGVNKFVIVDVPSEIGGLEVSNLNRQVGGYKDTAEYISATTGEKSGGNPKAEVVARDILRKNPYAEVHAISKILTEEEIRFLLRRADVAFWGHDDPEGVMHLLETARGFAIPVFSGLDLATNAYLRVILNDREDRQRPVLNGAITFEEALALAKIPTGKLTFLAKSAGIPIEQMIPLELLQNIVAIATGKTKILSQVPLAVGTFAEQTAFRVATLAKEIKGKRLDRSALKQHGLKKEVFYRNWEQNFGVLPRLKREVMRLAYLSNRQIQQLLGYENGMNPVRYSTMVVKGLFSALIGK